MIILLRDTCLGKCIFFFSIEIDSKACLNEATLFVCKGPRARSRGHLFFLCLFLCLFLYF